MLNMAGFQWRDEYAIGFPQIDQQHRNLIALLNRMHAGESGSLDRECYSQILVEVLEYTATHFHAEETVMSRIEYPGYENHRDEHAAFAKSMFALVERFERNEPGIAQDIEAFVTEWLAHHLLNVDLKIRTFLESRAAAAV
jgi:hemerythrin-like metal-binding protein